MRLSGAAAGPDAVLAWTGERELTRFERSGGRSSFTVPVPPLAAQLADDGVRIVDERGTVHHYSPSGQHVGAVALRAPLAGPIVSAALGAESPRMAVVIRLGEDTGETYVFENGEPVAWAFTPRLDDGYREAAVDLSRDGQRLLVYYVTFSYFTGEGSAGNRGEGVRVSERDGTTLLEQYDWTRDIEDVALSWDGAFVVCNTRWNDRRQVRYGTQEEDWAVWGKGNATRFTVGPDLVGALYTAPSQLAVHEISTRRAAQLDLPEQFDDLIFCGDDVVLVQCELGAWWLPRASLPFEDMG